MKKIYLLLLTAALAFAVSCEKTEINNGPDQPGPDDPEIPEVPAPVYTVKLSLPEGYVMSWKAGDAVAVKGVEADGVTPAEVADATVTAVDEADGAAVLEFRTLPLGGKMWFGYNAHEPQVNKFEYNRFSASVSQAEAGVVNPDCLMLVSDALEVPEDAIEEDTELDAVDMKIVGTLMRCLVYSPQGTYADESLLSVKLVSTEGNIAGTTDGCIAYDFLKDGQYWNDMEGNVSGKCSLFWMWENASTTITASLGSTLPMTGITDAAGSKALYLAVPPVEVGGYSWEVTTDKATYFFYGAKDEAVTFGENELKDVDLDLERCSRRIGVDDILGELKYNEGLAVSYSVPCDAGVTGLHYVYAQIKDYEPEDSEWKIIENNGDGTAYYSNVVFEVIDDATGKEADWCSVAYRANDTWWDCTVAANTSASPRSATVTARYAKVGHYALAEGQETKTTRIVQDGYSAFKTITVWGGINDAYEIDAVLTEPKGLSWWVLAANGKDMTDWNDAKVQELYKACVFKVTDSQEADGKDVDWCTAYYKRDAENKDRVIDTWWMVEAKDNTTGEPRVAYIHFTVPQLEGYVHEIPEKVVRITQKAQ